MMADSVVSTIAAPASQPADETAASHVAATKDEAKALNGTDKSSSAAAAAFKEDNRLSNGEVECGVSLLNGKTMTASDKEASTVTEKQHSSSPTNNVSSKLAVNSDSEKIGDTSSKQEPSISDKSVDSEEVGNSSSKQGASVSDKCVSGKVGDTSNKQETSVSDKSVDSEKLDSTSSKQEASVSEKSLVEKKAADKSSCEGSKEKAETNGKVEMEDSNGSAIKSDSCVGEDKIKPKEVEKELNKNDRATTEGNLKVAEDKEVTKVKSSESKGVEDDDDKSNSGESPSKASKPESVDLASGTDESSARKASDSTDNDTPKKKKKKKLSAVEEDGTPKETRRSSRQRKPVSYVDDVKITPKDGMADTSRGGGGSDIEMIEEGDPLAISDADVKKAQQRDKMGSNAHQQNVIVIDTNTLLRNQGNLAAAVAHQRPSSSSTASSMHQLNQQINNHSITLTQHSSHHHHHHQQQQANSNAAAVAQAQQQQQQQHQQQQHQQQQHQQQQQQQQQHQQQHASQQLLQNAAQNVSSVGGTLNIGGINLSAAAIANNPAALQNAIAAITGGANAPPGLKNAYITAVQQVLVQQQAAANTTPAGQQYLANLQQYYNTLGALRDEAYVIEAPSFIVPYVMEGKPKESIKDFLKRTNKEHEECEKKEKEKKGNEEKEKKDLEVKEKKDLEVKEKKDLEVKEKKDLEVKEKKDKESKEAADSEKKIEKKSEDKKEDEKMETDDNEKENSRESNNVEKDSAKKDEKDDGDKEKDDGDKEKDDGDKDKDDRDKEKDDKENVKEDKENVEKDNEKDGKKEASVEDTKVGKTEDDCKGAADGVTKNTAVASDENKENTEGKEAEEGKEDTSKPEEDANLNKYKNDDYSHLGRWEGYYKSSLGAFVLDLGLSLAQEFIQADLLKMQKRKLDKMKTQPSRQDISAVKALDRQLSKSREKNVHLRMPSKLCKFCNYRTDSKLVMDRHLESPHMVNYTYKCNFCSFETRGPQVILFHMEAEHMVRGRLERAPAFFQCQLCPFEDNNKSKMTRHSFSCAKKFKPEKNCEMLDWEPPAKIPKQMTRGRTLPVGSNIKNIGGNLYDASGRSLLPKGLPPGLTMQQLQTAVAQGLLPNPNAAAAAAAAANAANNLNRGRGRPIGSYKSPMPGPGGVVPPRPMGPGGAFNRGPGPATPQLSQQQQLALAGQLFQGMQAGKGLKSGQTPSISITALPRAGGASTAGAAAANLSATATGVKTATGKDGKPSFVICEICDGYIKDLEQLRNHMNFIHKVKIHPKMIYNRPPLNCQKCQHRFFTDQGLERHLLGTHGLVTSSMQEAANKSKDAGRCPICGKVFQWKLLNHVARDHKMTLKPAHLSYKCTVCTATFNMYRLFENHVYSAHSVVNKQKEGSGSGQSKTNGSADAPLKINDEITIIPQPSSSKGSSSGQRLLEKKKDGTPANVNKEITITKVGTAPIVNRSSASRNSLAGTAIKAGSSVEVISLDESPAKKAAAIALATKRFNASSSADSMAGPSKKSRLA